jgi:excisionase family DNA binding protein
MSRGGWPLSGNDARGYPQSMHWIKYTNIRKPGNGGEMSEWLVLRDGNKSEQPSTMTVSEMADRLGIDPSTAYRYLRVGELPGVRVGSTWLIDRERVERFLAGQEDASGRPLVEQPLTIEPQQIAPEMPDAGLGWLRGALAALTLLVDCLDDSILRDIHEGPEMERTDDRARSGR